MACYSPGCLTQREMDKLIQWAKDIDGYRSRSSAFEVAQAVQARDAEKRAREEGES